MFTKVFLVLLSIFLLLFGISQVTNLEITYMRPLIGFSALIAGVIGIVTVINDYRSPRV